MDNLYIVHVRDANGKWHPLAAKYELEKATKMASFYEDRGFAYFGSMGGYYGTIIAAMAVPAVLAK